MVELDPKPPAPAASDAQRRKRKEQLEGIDYGPLADWIGFHLRLAQIASFQAFANEALEVDLSPGRFALLMLIGRNPGISQTTLSRAHGSDKSTLTPALNDLKRRGLITRGRLKSDRRSYELALTAAGQDLLARLTQCATRHDQNLDRIIGPRDRGRFLKLLRKLHHELG
ncbi:MAG TPA: MarR family transcriptional regulator [Hyphomicrobiaceae bacterium]|nr:MarR family transcriptional regulator [Hyphomicrobiaceae bacterium]